MGAVLDWARDGAARYRGALTQDETDTLREIADSAVSARPGRRLQSAPPFLVSMLGADGAAGCIATALLGPEARPVRLLVFDKTPDMNWAVAWHQDRTIAVKSQRETSGFGPWSVKDGAPHVAPPVDLLARMITLRLHLDDCGDDNAPLRIAPGSHRIGLVPAAEAASVAEAHSAAICHAKAGDIWAYRTLILHASNTAASPARRRVLHIDYAAEDLPNGLEWLGLAANAKD